MDFLLCLANAIPFQDVMTLIFSFGILYAILKRVFVNDEIAVQKRKPRNAKVPIKNTRKPKASKSGEQKKPEEAASRFGSAQSSKKGKSEKNKALKKVADAKPVQSPPENPVEDDALEFRIVTSRNRKRAIKAEETREITKDPPLLPKKKSLENIKEKTEEPRAPHIKPEGVRKIRRAPWASLSKGVSCEGASEGEEGLAISTLKSRLKGTREMLKTLDGQEGKDEHSVEKRDLQAHIQLIEREINIEEARKRGKKILTKNKAGSTDDSEKRETLEETEDFQNTPEKDVLNSGDVLEDLQNTIRFICRLDSNWLLFATDVQGREVHFFYSSSKASSQWTVPSEFRESEDSNLVFLGSFLPLPKWSRSFYGIQAPSPSPSLLSEICEGEALNAALFLPFVDYFQQEELQITQTQETWSEQWQSDFPLPYPVYYQPAEEGEAGIAGEYLADEDPQFYPLYSVEDPYIPQLLPYDATEELPLRDLSADILNNAHKDDTSIPDTASFTWSPQRPERAPI